MMNIVVNIEQLLVQHKQVAFPGLGIFSIYEKPAHISATAITPRMTAVRFHATTDCNDGLLSQQLMEKNNISYREAMRRIETAATSITAKLNDGNVVLGSLGTLFRADQTIYFISSEAKFLPQNLGLAPLAITHLRKEQNNTITIQLPKRRSDLFKYVAAASIGLALMVFGPNTQNPYNLNASLMPFKINMNPPVQLTLSEATETIENTEIDSTLIDTHQLIQYHVIVASLKSKQQADEFIASNRSKLNGLQILQGKHAYRIVSASYNNLNEAINSMRTIRNTTPFTSAWVYTKQ